MTLVNTAHQSLLGQESGLVEGAADAHAHHDGRTGVGAGLFDNLDDDKRSKRLEKALDICMADTSMKITGRADGCSCSEFGEFVMNTLVKITADKD